MKNKILKIAGVLLILVAVAFIVIPQSGCSSLELTTKEQVAEPAGIEQLTDLVQTYFAGCESAERIVKKESSILSEASLRLNTIVSAVVGFPEVKKELRDLQDSEIFELVKIGDSYNLGAHKAIYKQACKLVLIGFQTSSKFIKEKEPEDSTKVSDSALSVFQVPNIRGRL